MILDEETIGIYATPDTRLAGGFGWVAEAACRDLKAVLPAADALREAAEAIVEMLPHGEDRYRLRVALDEMATVRALRLR